MPDNEYLFDKSINAPYTTLWKSSSKIVFPMKNASDEFESHSFPISENSLDAIKVHTFPTSEICQIDSFAKMC